MVTATVDAIQVTPGQGPKVAIYDITESATTKILQRVALSDPLGNALSIGAPAMAVSLTPTVAIGASYVAGDVVGGLLSFAGVFGDAGSGVIRTVRVTCNKVETQELILFLFNSNPTSSTFSNSLAPAIAPADAPHVLMGIVLSPLNGLGTHTIWSATVDAAVDTPSTGLWGVLVTNDAFVNNLTSTTDMTVELTVTPDIAT